MNNAILQAKELLDALGWREPGDMTMEDIAWASSLIVTRKEMSGSEGRILMNKDTSLITIDSGISYQPKINYILAHEIGHSRLHRDISFFSDNGKTLSEWYSGGGHEAEANDFACELLMPSDLFKKKVRGKKLDLGLIEMAAEYFGASKTATFLRYRDLGDFPVMIVFIEKGIVKWRSCSEDFPFTWLPLKSNVPAWTVAGDYFKTGVIEPKPEKVEAIEWFADDFKIKGNETMKLWEQCFPVASESILSCIWTF